MIDWQYSAEAGFLVQPAPVQHLGDVSSSLTVSDIDALERLAHDLPDLLAEGAFREAIADFPQVDLSVLADESTDRRLLERAHMLYGYFASAYFHQVDSPPVSRLPAVLAVPLVTISDTMERLPYLAYSGMVLNNWRRIDPDGDITPENLDVQVSFTGLADEAWFFNVHTAIEARAGRLLAALVNVQSAIQSGVASSVLRELRTLQQSLVDITSIFHDIGQGCDPDCYFLHIRPYFFGVDDVTYDGVDDTPRTYRGGSGAQSSIVPAVLAALELNHERNALTMHLEQLHGYMPPEHRRFIERLEGSGLREFCARYAPLRDAYNRALLRLTTFRRAHLHYAHEYIFKKSPTTKGTGGTEFMAFLSRLIDETTAQYL